MKTPRFPRFYHGALLAMMGWVTVIATGTLSPVLPKISQHFAGTAHLELMIGFLATIPALSVALLAVVLGSLADRFGQRRVLLCGLLGYGIFGILPYWLESLQAIIATRLVVGIGEAAVMTASTAMIGVYFSGKARERWLAIQVTSANVVGVMAILAGGVAGNLDWRLPFLAYSFALLLLLLAVALLPHRDRKDVIKMSHAKIDRQLRLALLRNCGLLIFSIIGLYILIIQMAFLLDTRGAIDSATIGFGISLAAAGVAIGAAFSAVLAGIPRQIRMPVALVIMAVGFAGVALAANQVITIASGTIAGLGVGLILPPLLASTLAQTAPGNIGIVCGIWTSSVFIGQFVNPPLFIALRSLTGSQEYSILGFAGACAVLALLMAALPLSRKPVGLPLTE